MENSDLQPRSAKATDMIQVEPQVLRFQRPFNVARAQTVTVANRSPERIAFKVKTTAPKMYLVRPNCGVLGAGEHCVVSIVLQPQQGPAEAKAKDKFLLQTAPVPASVTVEKQQDPHKFVDEIFNATDKDALGSYKLSAVYVGEEVAPAAAEATATSPRVPSAEPAASPTSLERPERDAAPNRGPSTAPPAPPAATLPVTDMPVASAAIPTPVRASSLVPNEPMGLRQRTKGAGEPTATPAPAAKTATVAKPEPMVGVSRPLLLLLVLVAFAVGFQLGTIVEGRFKGCV